jgi:cellulose synthase/poly-beta-1,6-N-acetylglucosamine synthase-like glycosyltransferase
MVYICVLVLLIRSIVSNFWIFLVLRRIRRYQAPTDTTLESDRSLIIILPVLEETVLVRGTMEYILECIRGRTDIELWVVGTTRERVNHGDNATLNIARAVARQHRGVRVLEADDLNGRMAHQINFALRLLLASERDVGNTWVFITNIDSRFSKRALDTLVCKINRQVPVMLQSAVFLDNFRCLSLLGRGFAIWQSRWTVAHELRRLTVHNRWTYYLAHVVGHGLCINLCKIREFGLLPEDTPTEDLHFGFLLAASGERIRPLWVFEIADHPRSLSETLRQKMNWANGPILYPKYLMRFRATLPDKWRQHRLRSLIIAAQGTVSALDWLLVSFLLAAFLVLSRHSILAALFLTFYCIEYLQCAVFFCQQGWIRYYDVVWTPVLVLVAGLLHSPPALACLIVRVAGRGKKAYKTRHA